jgi:hypothetical protein
MSRTLSKLPESVVAERDALQPLLHDGTCTSTSPRRESNIRERKRYQNRIAQRTYRKDVPLLISFARPMGAAHNLCRCLGRNQKQKLLALEAVAGQSSGIVASSLTTTCTSNIRDSDPCDPSYDDQMWNFDPLLNESPPPGVLPSLGRTALHRAICNGNEAIVRLLLERGADIIRQDSYGSTALHLAVENGCEGLVKVLLENITDPNLTDSLGRTALFLAVQSENEMVAKLLLDASIDVNWRDSLGNVALHIAAERGSEALTLLLLKYGANIDA